MANGSGGVITTIVTNAGIAAAIAAGNEGPQININGFQIGQDIITPDPTLTAVSTAVYIGSSSQIQYEILNNNTVVYVITLDETVGDFTIGNIGLFTNTGTMFAISALPIAEPKLSTSSLGLGTRRIFNIIITLSQLATISEFVIEESQTGNLPEVANETLLPNANTSVYDTYLCDVLNFTGRGFPGLASRFNGQWWFVQLGDDALDMPYTEKEANARFGPLGGFYATDTGPLNAMAATFPIPITAMPIGTILWVNPQYTNTSTSPTISINGSSPITITDPLGAPLTFGEIVSGIPSEFMVGPANQVWLLQPNETTVTAGPGDLPEVSNETLLPNPTSSQFDTYLVDVLEFTGRGFPGLASRYGGKWWYVQLGDDTTDMPYTAGESDGRYAKIGGLYCVDSGTLNTLVGTLPINIASMPVGTTFYVNPAFTTTSVAPTVKINAASPVVITNPLGQQLGLGAIVQGIPSLFMVGPSGAVWLLQSEISLPVIPPPTAPTLTFYVRTDGNNSNSGTVNTAAGAFATVMGALTAISNNYGFVAGRTITIILGVPGTYTGNLTFNITGISILLEGLTAAPASYIISGGSGADVINVNNGCTVTLENLTINNVSNANNWCSSISGAELSLINVYFTSTGVCPTYCCRAYPGGICNVESVQCNVTSGCAGLLYCHGGGVINLSPDNAGSIYVNGAAFSDACVHAHDLGYLNAGTCTITGTSTGYRYKVTNAAVVNVNGQGNNFFPGTIAGTAVGSTYSP
jgi:hypothetical protein